MFNDMHTATSPQIGLAFARLATAVILLVAPATHFAQAPAQTPAPADAAAKAAEAAEMARPLAPAEKKFIKETTEGLYYELAIVEIAQRRNRPVGVGRDAAHQLGAKLHPELQKAYADLTAFARAKNEPVRDELSGVEKRDVEQLRDIDLEKFKKEIVKLLSKESKKLSDSFASPFIQHSTLKKIVATHAPILKRHVQDVAEAGK
jgi:hypothetical protein